MPFHVHTQVYVDKVSQEKELLQTSQQLRRAQAHSQCLSQLAKCDAGVYQVHAERESELHVFSCSAVSQAVSKAESIMRASKGLGSYLKTYQLFL